MSALDKLTVSLTKNGYNKIADIVIAVPRNQILNNLDGQIAGIHIDAAQVKKMLSYDEGTQTFPDIWDEVRGYDHRSIRAFTFIAILFSHATFIKTFIASKVSEMRGVLKRADLGDKPYTNLVACMESVGLCEINPGSTQTIYNLTPLFDDLSLGPLAKRLLALKLNGIGWHEPQATEPFLRSFYEQCAAFDFNDVLAITMPQFEDWLEDRTVKHEQPPTAELPNTEVVVSANLLSVLSAKPFAILSGATGTGKTLTVRDMARNLSPSSVPPSFNHVFIPVAAGWTDARHLIGYRTPFGRDGEQYVSTPLVSLLLRASFESYAKVPFFVILDEMNLSHVEMYFAKFLSIMETLGIYILDRP